jgi:DNA gyrase/topoisomerase IV subunit A
MKSSEYILKQRRNFSLYVIQHRAIPHVSDGLKAAARRVLWTARNGQKYKSSALAGAVAPIHPHAAPEGTINTLAAPYGNNIPLLKGYGAFGTLLKPTSYGAARYTSVVLSKFAKDVLFKDIEIIPMVDNYDGSVLEPQHFLPIIPLVLLNPQEGIAVGFASKLLPRSINDIISHQILHLKKQNNKITEVTPFFAPTNQTSSGLVTNKQKKQQWLFHGDFKKLNATSIQITELPYGLAHQKFITNLETLEDNGSIIKITDDSSDSYNIVIQFKKGTLSKLSNDEIKEFVGINNSLSENMNVVNFDGNTIWEATYVDIIKEFTSWRLTYYTKRYERLADLIKTDIQRLKDVLLAIKKKVGVVATKTESRSELKEYLTVIGIIHIDYIADLPIHRFTHDEKNKTEKKLTEHLTTLDYYNELLQSEDKRRHIYIDELREILKNVKSNCYTQQE